MGATFLLILWLARAEATEQCNGTEVTAYLQNHLGAVVPQQSQHEDAARSVLKKDPESEDYLDRWRESWLEQSALNLPKEMFALLLKTAIGGFFGDLVGAVIKALWPPGIPKEQRMMEILIQWTKDHVDAAFLKHLRETVQAILDTSMRGPMDDYQMCSQKVKEEAKKAWFFPETHFQECLSHLDRARDFASLARNNIVASSWRGGSIPIYLVTCSTVMSLWREYYAAMRFYETWSPWKASGNQTAAPRVNESGQLTWTYSSKEVIQKMLIDYKNVSKDLDDIVQSWWKWRLGKIDTSYYSNCGAVTEKCKAHIDLDDRLQGKRHRFKSTERDGESAWMDCCTKVLDERVRASYNSTMHALELVPMLKPFTVLHRLIPGREEAKVEPGPLPQELWFGPISTWLMRARGLRESAKDRQSKTDAAVDSGHGSITMLGGRRGDIVDQLVFKYTDGTEVKLPGNSGDGDEIPLQRLPPFTCGMEVAYRANSIMHIAMLNIKNQSLLLAGHDSEKYEASDRITMGPSLCSLYTLHQCEYRSDVEVTGDAIECSFKWGPMEPTDF